MALDTAAKLLLLFHAVLLGVAATAIIVVGTLLAPPAWVDRPDAAARWVDEARPVVRDVARALDSGGAVSYDRLQRRLLSLASRLDRHAELAPTGVDDALVLGVTELGYGCRAVGMELTRSERLDWGAPGSEVAMIHTAAKHLLDELSKQAVENVSR